MGTEQKSYGGDSHPSAWLANRHDIMSLCYLSIGNALSAAYDQNVLGYEWGISTLWAFLKPLRRPEDETELKNISQKPEHKPIDTELGTVSELRKTKRKSDAILEHIASIMKREGLYGMPERSARWDDLSGTLFVGGEQMQLTPVSKKTKKVETKNIEQVRQELEKDLQDKTKEEAKKDSNNTGTPTEPVQ